MKTGELIREAVRLHTDGEVLVFANGGKFRATGVMTSLHYPDHLLVSAESDDRPAATPDPWRRRALCINGPLAGHFVDVNIQQRKHPIIRTVRADVAAYINPQRQSVETVTDVYELLEVAPTTQDSDRRAGLALKLEDAGSDGEVIMPQRLLDFTLAICRANGATL